MTTRQLDCLRRRFPMFERIELIQELLLAELETETDGNLALRAAQCNLLDQLEARRRRQARYPSISEVGENEGGVDVALELYFSDDEWRSVERGLPYPAQKLARLARREAERFEDVPGGVWTQQNLTELRRRIKREFIAWDRDNSERAYYRARATLVAALHRNRGRK